MGDFPRFGTVWYDPKGITNIILQDKVEAMGYNVTYDKENKQYIVTGKKGLVRFKKAEIGLWYYPLEVIDNKGITLVETLKDQMAGYSKRQVERATIAKNLYETIGFPSINDFKLVIKMNGI